MKTNLLAQNDDLVIENLKADVGKSVMNLSHSVTFPIDVDGAILPICCIETVPSDSLQISVECLLRQLSPLKVPLMTNLRLNTAFYYCDNRLAWKKWDRFMTGGRSGNELYDIPRVANIQYSKTSNPSKFDLLDISVDNPAAQFNHINYKTTLHSYFGISMNHFEENRSSYDDVSDFSSELPVAFPFFDYQMICRDYYTNVDRLPQNPTNNFNNFNYDDLVCDWAYSNLFPSDDDEIRLMDGVRIKSGFNSGDDSTVGTKGFILDKVRYHDVRPDYFTSSKKAPMRGDPPSLTSSVSQLVLPSGTKLNFGEGALALKGHASQSWSDGQGLHVKNYTFTPMTSTPELTDSNTKIRINNSISSAKQDYTAQAGEILAPGGYTVGDADGTVTIADDLVLSGQLATDWTAADIRLLSQLTVWQELNMLHEPYYNDFLNAHFDNVRVGESTVEKPQYIGGTSQVISINEILQTSQSTETSPLGNQGATAMSIASNNVGSYYCNNYGYIIGVCYIIPDMLYKPAMPRGFSRRTKEDYYSPEFANLSMQATLNKEIFFSNDDDWNNAPWGYTGAFDELRSIPNRIAGDLLNPDYTDLQKWVLTREMANDNLPAMESTWLSLKGNVDKSAWSVTSMPAFMLQCANYIKAVRPMPKVAIPKAL